MFRLLTPITYWVLIVMWSFILLFYLKRLRSKIIKRQLLFILLLILAIDAFRTLFESVYFGAWYTSLAGILPEAVYTFLVRPEMVFIPKIINVVAATVIIGILLYRWLPQEEQEKDQLEKLIQERTAELTQSNEQLKNEIVERKHAEKAVKARESFLDRVIDQSPFAIWISDTEGTLQRANPALKKFLNLTDEQLVGKYNVLEDKIAERKGLQPLFRTVFERIFSPKNGRRWHITFCNHRRLRSDWSFLLVCTFAVILGSTLGKVMDVFFKISLAVIVGIGMF